MRSSKAVKLHIVSVVFLLALLLSVLPLTAAAADSSAGTEIGSCVKVLTSNRNEISFGACVEETTLGDFAAMAILEETGADVALVCGGDMHHNLRAGSITSREIEEIFEDGYGVSLINVTPAQLYALLEYASSHTAIDESERVDPDASAFNGFVQPGGFSYRYDCSQLYGRRMKSIVLDDGTKLDPEDNSRILTAAVPESIFSEELSFPILEGIEKEGTGYTEAELVIRYILKHSDISTPRLNRIVVIGTADYSIINSVRFGGWSPLYLLPFILLIIVLVRLPRQKHRLRNLDGSLSERYSDYEFIDPEQEARI